MTKNYVEFEVAVAVSNFMWGIVGVSGNIYRKPVYFNGKHQAYPHMTTIYW